jgi:glutathione S-transferase
MIKLYHCADARSFRALWALEEVGVPYQLELLPFPPRFLKREYLDINPLGTIPLLIDGETRMTESAAICQYLGDRYGAPPLRVARDEPAYGAYLNALHFGEATLTFPQTIVLRYGALEPAERRLPQAVTDYSRWTLARMKALVTLMADAEYVCAGRFTMADISIAYAVMLSRAIGLGAEVPEALSLYFDRLAARPAFARAKQAQAGGPTSALPVRSA